MQQPMIKLFGFALRVDNVHPRLTLGAAICRDR
jgi:hypothetical protein